MWQLRDRVHPVLTDDGGAILDERSGRWTHLVPTAAAAVLALCACTTMEQAARQYATRYGLTTDHATADITTVADALVAAGIATTNPRPRRSWWWSR